jgi:hypothetical protein
MRAFNGRIGGVHWIRLADGVRISNAGAGGKNRAIFTRRSPFCVNFTQDFALDSRLTLGDIGIRGTIYIDNQEVLRTCSEEGSYGRFQA